METPAHPVVPVILSGGTGTRLWPMSREEYPKQLLALDGETSLFQQTALRVHGGCFTDPLVVCGEMHRFIIAEQLRALWIDPMAVVLEPIPRGTAAALAVAAQLVLEHEPEALMLVCPSDHRITDHEAFRAAVQTAAAVAAEGRLVTFGVEAARPETGYGYIRSGRPVEGHPDAADVGEFVEKPALDQALQMIGDGTWTWNSGMFLFPPDLFLAELRRYAPDVASGAAGAVADAEADLDFLRLDEDAFAECPTISVDHAVMEHTTRAAVVEAGFDWDDLGSWSSLWRTGERDAADNVLVGDVLDVGSENCYVHSNGVLVTTLGLRDTVVVATPDVVLVADRSRDQEVKDLVARLRASRRTEVVGHPVTHRPWGTYEIIDAGPGYQVKHLIVKPDHRLSLQKHAHRAEHWSVISGTADVIRGSDVLTLTEGASIDIPVGCVHRLGNSGRDLLHLIEVQRGSYLGEDDIVRLDDSYGRLAPAAGA